MEASSPVLARLDELEDCRCSQSMRLVFPGARTARLRYRHLSGNFSVSDTIPFTLGDSLSPSQPGESTSDLFVVSGGIEVEVFKRQVMSDQEAGKIEGGLVLVEPACLHLLIMICDCHVVRARRRGLGRSA